MKYLIYFYWIYFKYFFNKVWWLLLIIILVVFVDGLGIFMLLFLLQSLEVIEQGVDDNIFFNIIWVLGVFGFFIGIFVFMFVIFLGKVVLKFGVGYFKGIFYKDFYCYLKINFYDVVLKVDY